jgi:hypothetical protein
VLVVAHPNDRQTYENGWTDGRLDFITTNQKIFNQCVRALDGGNEWVYVQRMPFGSSPSRIIGRVRVARFDEPALRVWFEDWEAHDAAPQPAFGGSYFAQFPDRAPADGRVVRARQGGVEGARPRLPRDVHEEAGG